MLGLSCCGAESAQQEDEVIASVRDTFTSVSAVDACEAELDFTRLAPPGSYCALVDGTSADSLQKASAVVHWLGLRRSGGEDSHSTCYVLPSPRSLQIGLSKLVCHTALQRFKLPTPRVVACLDSSGLQRASATAAGGYARVVEDLGGHPLTDPSSGVGLQYNPAKIPHLLASDSRGLRFPVIILSWPRSQRHLLKLLFVRRQIRHVTVVTKCDEEIDSAGLDSLRLGTHSVIGALRQFMEMNEIELAQVEICSNDDLSAISM